MNTLNKISDKKSKDPFDKIIFEKGLRIQQILANKKLNILVILLNTGIVIKASLSQFPKLKNAEEKDLNSFELIGGGIGIHWEHLNEDLSLKGLIKESALNEVLRKLKSKDNSELAIF